jgi:hypothetical protein
MTQDKALEIQAFWNTLNRHNLDSLGDFYSIDIQFEDPIRRGKGIADFTRHFSRIFRSLSQINYTYGNSLQSSNTLVMEWTLNAKMGSTEKRFEMPGISWLELNNETEKIERSREYFDLGKGYYEYIPILGYCINMAKSRLCKF